MKYVRFRLKEDIDLEEAWSKLEMQGCTLLYSSEDDFVKEIFGYIPDHSDLEDIEDFAEVFPAVLESIDWHSQWQEFGYDFYDGYVHVDVGDKKLLLEPGPGFGNLSHPTTRLVLKLMEDEVQGKVVVDVGSGSGILALAALQMGAKLSIGIDIDSSANEHAEKNAKINQLEGKCSFSLPEDFKLPSDVSKLCIVMNMIKSEQAAAWDTLMALHGIPADLLVSGILSEERDAYLQLVQEWGWQPLLEIEEDGWLAFHCTN